MEGRQFSFRWLLGAVLLFQCSAVAFIQSGRRLGHAHIATGFLLGLAFSALVGAWLAARRGRRERLQACWMLALGALLGLFLPTILFPRSLVLLPQRSLFGAPFPSVFTVLGPAALCAAALCTVSRSNTEVRRSLWRTGPLAGLACFLALFAPAAGPAWSRMTLVFALIVYGIGSLGGLLLLTNLFQRVWRNAIVAGLVLLVAAVSLLVNTYNIPQIWPRVADCTLSAIAAMRTIDTAEQQYRTGEVGARYGTLATLSDPRWNPPYLDEAIGSGTRMGYTFALTLGPDGKSFSVRGAPGWPGVTGNRFLYADSDGIVINYSRPVSPHNIPIDY